MIPPQSGGVKPHGCHRQGSRRSKIHAMDDKGAMPSARDSRSLRQPRSIVLVAALVVAMAFVGAMLAATDGHFVAQVVDLYVSCQYAKAMAEGHPFQYNAGEPGSSGATSFLHTVLLALAHALGARGEGLVAVAIVMGSILLVASALLARRIGLLLRGEREALLAAGLVVLGGPVVWGFMYGADIALFMFLTIWLLERLLVEWPQGRLGGGVAAAALLALARPEGLVAAPVLGIAWSLGPARRGRGFARLLAWLPAVAGLAVLVVQRWATGRWLGTSFSEKSLFANYSVNEGLIEVADYLVDVLRGLLLGLYPSQTPMGFARGWASFFFPPLGLLLILIAFLRPPAERRTPLRVWGALVAALFLLLTPNMFMGVHFHRYLMWAFPALLALVAVGWGELAERCARDDEAWQRSLFRMGSAVFLILGLLSTLRFAASYGGMAGEVYRRDLAAAQWIARNLPPGVAMANLATSVEYLTGHRNLNLHGVTNPLFTGGRSSEREAQALEILGRLPATERPSHLITTEAAQEAYATMREMVREPPLYRSASFSPDEILVYAMRYDLAGKSGRVYLPETLKLLEGLREVDRLNVCDPQDEGSHGYRFGSFRGNLRLTGTARIDSYALPGGVLEVVADGGRAILGSESFSVRAERGKDLVVVMRTAPQVRANVMRAEGSGRFDVAFAEAGMVVEAAGVTSARFQFRPRPGWDEYVFRIPGGFLKEGSTRLTLSGRYASFFYWFYQ